MTRRRDRESLRFLVVTHVLHSRRDGVIYAYGPYVREMNLWFKHVEEVVIVAPISLRVPGEIEEPYVKQDRITFLSVPQFNITTVPELLRSVLLLPYVVVRVLQGMANADHLHLRCPGNMGFLGIVLSVLYPWKPKTIKYAGNWDPDSLEARSVRLQRQLLRHAVFPGRMRVLVYGEWNGMPVHVIPFFTASYSQVGVEPVNKDLCFNPTRLLFLGSLEDGKNPKGAVDFADRLASHGLPVQLNLLGDGRCRAEVEQYIEGRNQRSDVFLHGALSADAVVGFLHDAHFVVLLSRTEGWPKALAEGMFHGAVPVASRVSCVPWMLDNGKRGIIDNGNLSLTVESVYLLIRNPDRYCEMSTAAAAWSRQYTLETFDMSISNILTELHQEC